MSHEKEVDSALSPSTTSSRLPSWGPSLPIHWGNVTEWIEWILSYALFLARGTFIAIADFYVMYVRVGCVWRQGRERAPSMERRDLVMQLAPQSPCHSKLDTSIILLHLNTTFIDRALWNGLSSSSALPSAVVSGISCGGIGFYTAMNLLLCGFNVHGVGRNPKRLLHAQSMMEMAVARQCRLHKEWAGRTGRLKVYLCNMSDTAAVSRVCGEIGADANLRVVVCNAGAMCTPPMLSPNHLEEQFAAHHVGHSLLTLRLLQHRLSVQQRQSRQLPPLRIVLLSSAAAATAAPSAETTFHEWRSQAELKANFSRFSGYGNAKMCELLYAFALSRFVEGERRLAGQCTVNVLHPGPIRSRVIPNSGLPLQWLTDGDLAAVFRMTPAIAALYVADLALGKRHDRTTGHFFRMGEDQSEYYADMVSRPRRRRGFFLNSTMFPGIPGPAVSLSLEQQEWLWKATLKYFEDRGLIEPGVFY